VINTGTTIVTFLMVFLIQSSQNRDSAAIQVKLDELLRRCGSEFARRHRAPYRRSAEDIRNKCEARAIAEKAGDETFDKTQESARRAADRIAN
jgi:low affinity Fe/Cu permease